MNQRAAAAVELRFSAVDPARVDALSDLLEELGAVAVSVLTDPAERAFAEPGFETAPLALPADVSAHFAPGTDVDALRETLRGAFQPVPPLTVNHLAHTDWTAAAAARSGSAIVGNRVWIGPEHQAPPAGAGLLRVSITPGMAFGTGEHPTTRLAAQALVDNAGQLRDADVIDYGCGSAVLAIIAARLGAARVAAIDIDPVACDVAR
ncbi:MAG: 50S ribosomal protein L11 methyltransferase, partial [Gammaproteobacteria bacterium]|nr:50S ribosomal protein L11 methyltransferase [Gammaproteobacteria bacterium]